jgi:hypothetical protein
VSAVAFDCEQLGDFVNRMDVMLGQPSAWFAFKCISATVANSEPA